MQFLAYHNSPQTYWHLGESNFLYKDDNNHFIHRPGLGNVKQSNPLFHTFHQDQFLEVKDY